ncbi:hypothetical protein ACFQ1E_12050 [Sphingomonas canadensis]|uniref:Uncharacterized protein n=1 Tax=Sphingomonas canadensis TaxID=1219257 RepID=A0ABW3HA83_9SPHN|nr:hypothetical protein [Sphingomonas canadensis]MCW3836793.1 hypothetical protein [Sphingomonas canadensis]
MTGAALSYPAQFDAASPRFYPGEAEFDIERAEGVLTLSLPVADDAPLPDAVDAARSLLGGLDALDGEARAWLRAQPGWPYGDDALLWLVLVEGERARFCYRQESVNDEQVIGFARVGGGQGGDWRLTGPDPRHRG